MKRPKRITWMLAMLALCGPAWGANVFTGDPNCIADWTMDEDVIIPGDVEGADILNAQELIHTASLDQADKKEGDGSIDYDGELNYSFRFDSELVAGFPLKGNDTNKILSCTFWLKADSLPAEGDWMLLVGKGNYAGPYQWSWRTMLYTTGGSTHLRLGIGYGATGQTYESYNHASALQAGRWYHVGVTFQDSDGAYHVRIWDDTAGEIVGTDLTGNFTNRIYLSADCEFIMCSLGALLGCSFDGHIDELVFFNDILTATVGGEIDQVRAGTYGQGVGSLRRAWWWRRRHEG